MRLLPIFILSLFLFGCGNSPTEEVNQSIDIALSYLSKNKCDEAIKVLEDTNKGNSNGIYLQVLASAYACKAQYNEIDFISDDLEGMTTTNLSTIFKSAAQFDLSTMTAADDDDYESIRHGILLVSDDKNHAGRVAKFGTRRAGDMGIQVLLLSLVNLGKYLHYYGNASAAGVKGGGTGSNSCFIDYTDVSAQAVITSGVTGACTTHTDGHPDLSLTTDATNAKKRMCQGLILVTNIIDVLDNVTISSSDLGNLDNIKAQIDLYKTAAETAGLGTLLDTTTQTACETLMNTNSNVDDLELFFALIFEQGLK